ncbi:MAG TPA: BMP family ABC transporter substrate-binding protein, partial [Clostridia bacterium]|nr:BMP family ABC transporter substrate-binding protein [Clostridia bacterium]
GSIEACKERGVYAIGGAGGDQFEAAPDTVVVSVIKDISVPIMFAYETYLAGELEPKIYRVGVAEKAVYYSPFHDFEDFVSQDVKDKLAEIVNDLATGKVSVKDIGY